MNPIFYRYKIPFLIALVVGLAAVVLGGVASWITAVWAFFGAIIGIFIIDMEYVLNAYVIDPSTEVSGFIRELIHKKDYKGYFNFLNNNEYKFKDLAIHSTFFVILLAGFALYTSVGSYWIFAKTLTVTMYAMLVYESIIELARTKTLKRWFWFYNGEISYRASVVYCACLVGILVLIITFL